MHIKLFGAAPTVDRWFPDETLFSLASRYHWILGSHRPDLTCRALFGHARRGSSHDFPAHVEEFASRTYGVLGESRKIILEHTLLPYFLPFRTQSDAENSISAAKGSGLGNLKGRLGILASRFGAAHPLKACVTCMAIDRSEHGTSYWHRDHQWPGVWVCHIHGTELLRALGKVNSQGRFHWLVPEEMAFAAPADPGTVLNAMPKLRLLAEAAIGLGNLPPGSHFDPALVLQTYQVRLRDLDIAGAMGRLNLTAWASLLESTCGSLGGIHGLQALDGRESSLLSQFTRLVQSSRGVAHPLRYLLLSITLFGSWSQFVAAYRSCERLEEEESGCLSFEPPPPQGREPLDARHQRVVESVRGGASVSATAASAGVTVATAMAWIAAVGLRTPRRPKLLTLELRELAIRRLHAGASKDAVSGAIGLSVQTVTHLLRTEPGLRVAWHHARRSKAQRVARKTWIRTAGRLAFPTLAVMRQLQPAVFAWLYRNDRAWLQEFGQDLPRHPRTNGSGVRWDKRDVEISAAVRRAALAHDAAQPEAALRLSHLCDAVAVLKGRLSSLDRLPLTRAAIAEVTIRRRRT
jgi:hypothetical protein